MKMIDVQGLNFDYPDKRALFDINFSIDKGAVVALVGPNGAGKTTLLRCIAGLERIHSGRVVIDTLDVADHPREVHSRIGYLSDSFGLYNALNLRQCLTYMAWCHKIPELDVKKRVLDVAHDVGIENMMDTKAGVLSRGYRQRLGIGLALIHDPKIIILDEPASGMDPEARIALSQMMRRLRAAGKTLIVSSHILNELEDYCTEMLVMKDGRLAEHVKLGDYSARPERTLQISVTGLSVGHMELLGGQPYLKIRATHENTVTCEYSGTVEDQQKLLHTLVAAGVPVFSFSTEAHTLADAYMNATGGRK
jgi:ABC-2 type transport system ATP-binding protein